MKVFDLMTPSVSYVRPETSIRRIAQQMRSEDVGFVPVCDDAGAVLGIVTDRDIILRWLPNPSESIRAMDIMSRNPITASPSMNMHEVSVIMAAKQVRRLPVVYQQQLVGVISLSDLARRSLYIDEAGDALSAISKNSPKA